MSGLINWCSQVAAVTRFGLLSVPQRLGSVSAAAFGIAGVVAVLVGVLSMAAGFRKTIVASGSPDTALVLRTGADSEMVSGLGLEDVRIISDAPGVIQTPQGPLTSAELFVIINIPKRSTGTDANVPLRGVQQGAFRVRDKFKIERGRAFEWGLHEAMVGVGAARAFAGTEVGETIRVGRDRWPIVGVFSAGGSSAESEIWTDAKVLQAAYERGESFQSVSARLASASAFTQFKDALTTDPRVSLKVLRQAEYYEEQSTAVTRLITTLGSLVCMLMAAGAVFGALNTMYTAVAGRKREIATLRALGFGRAAVVISVMLESLVIALVGGSIGALLAYALLNGFQASTMNWASFSMVTFAFDVNAALLVQGIVWATVIGLIGGCLPAIRAARVPIAAALREL